MWNCMYFPLIKPNAPLGYARLHRCADPKHLPYEPVKHLPPAARGRVEGAQPAFVFFTKISELALGGGLGHYSRGLLFSFCQSYRHLFAAETENPGKGSPFPALTSK